MFHVFSDAVKNATDQTAIILSNKANLSYKQVSELATAWSKYFISVGVGQGDRIAVLTDHEDLHPFIHLALDQINATVVPLDSEIPSAQLELDINNLCLKKIVIDKNLCQRYVIPEAIKLYAPETDVAPENHNELSNVVLPIIERDPKIPNYIVASSGVTQNKKWIPIRSAGLSYWAEIETNLLQLSPKDKILCTRSPAYDARISEYIRSFAAGSTLVLLSHAERRDFNVLLEQCEKEKISCLILIASQLAIPNLDSVIKRLADAGLVHLMVTGDACSLRLKQLCEQNNINLWNCYGPTEATFGMSIFRVNNEELVDENQYPIVPIGVPNSNEVKFHLIDERLYIESPFLSDGYINNPQQTEKNFPTLFIDGRWVRVFDTENRFLLKDGKLVFKGRISSDAHCKVSGVKVDPYAIQLCIEKYNDEMGEDVLHAYVVVKPWLNNYKPFAYIVVQHDFSRPHFMSFLKKWLRKEEIPIIVELADFPRLIPSEKIDQRALIDRVDHADEFFFNEGIRNKQKFSKAGQGLVLEDENELNDLVVKILEGQLPLMEDDTLFKYIDRLVLSANHLDQALNTQSAPQNTVINWLAAAYVLLTKQRPKYALLLEAKDNASVFEDVSISALSSIAQLLHYYGKALRYATNEHWQRQHFLEKAVAIAEYLEHKLAEEDVHAFKGRLLTYNLSLMLCIRDRGDLNSALELAKQQSTLALEKQELFLVIQFESYRAELLMQMNQFELAYKHAQEAFLMGKKFYHHRLVYFNASTIYLKCCLKNKEEVRACELSMDILNAYKANPLCGAKSRHIQIAKETLQSFDPLTKIWCATLGLKQYEQDHEFMFLGGDSFQLNILLLEIQKYIDPSYRYQELINLPSITLEQIRHSLQNKKLIQNDRAFARPLFQIDSERENYFFLPPLLGEGYFTYKELAKVFCSHYKFNVYGLSDPSLFDEHLLPKTLAEAATRYVTKIREIQAHGPYYLLGFSYGGTLAYAVAQLLLAEGEEIKRLHIVDGFPPELYQKLPVKEHAALLEELINFVIKTLNNRFYNEGIKAIHVEKFDELSAKEQVNKAFDLLLLQVKKEPSRLLLALARQHLLFMLEAKEPTKLALWAQLYLSTPNQTYLDIIYRIQKIVKKSAACQSYYWNHYFEEVNVVGQRVNVNHLDLLKPQQTGLANSAHLFWQKAHDSLFNLQVDYLALKSFYFMEKLDNHKSSCQLYSLAWSSLAYYKKTFASWPQVKNLYAFPLYERVSEKYERKDRLVTTKYALSFIIENKHLGKLHEFLSQQQIQQYTPYASAESRQVKLLAQYIALQEREAPRNFFINLDIYWNGTYLLSLYFNCHADYKALLRRIYIELKMEIDNHSDIEVNLYNFTHLIFDISKPSIFDAVQEVSKWVNHFITLLIPHVQSHCIKENEQHERLYSLT